jgi:hypothetical protein
LTPFFHSVSSNEGTLYLQKKQGEETNGKVKETISKKSSGNTMVAAIEFG